MYYTTINDLPKTLQETLPVAAQTLYLETYNRIWEQYAVLGDDNFSRSTIANQMAWDEMMREFTLVKNVEGSRWYRKEEEPDLNGDTQKMAKKGLLERLGLC